MIRTVLYNPKTDKAIFGDEKLFSEWLHNTELWIWADFDNEDHENIDSGDGDISTIDTDSWNLRYEF